MESLETIPQWVEALTRVELPVLSRTVTELDGMRNIGENAGLQGIADAVLHDPFMTAKVLRYLQHHRGRRQLTDITTIAHALMMFGLSPFYAHFGTQDVIERRLAHHDTALKGVMRVMCRARHAALYAYDWAQLRKDINPEEIMAAALLHDLAEMLLWCFAPSKAHAIAAMQGNDRTLRSDIAQEAVLGFRLIDLQLAMIAAWGLPESLCALMDVHHGRKPRALTVDFAIAVARHSANGWDDAALPDDYAAMGEWIGIPAGDVEQRVKNVALVAASDASWYGIAFETGIVPATPY